MKELKNSADRCWFLNGENIYLSMCVLYSCFIHFLLFHANARVRVRARAERCVPQTNRFRMEWNSNMNDQWRSCVLVKSKKKRWGVHVSTYWNIKKTFLLLLLLFPHIKIYHTQIKFTFLISNAALNRAFRKHSCISKCNTLAYSTYRHRIQWRLTFETPYKI